MINPEQILEDAARADAINDGVAAPGSIDQLGAQFATEALAQGSLPDRLHDLLFAIATLRLILQPFAVAWNALPDDVRRHHPHRDLADVLGVFAPPDPADRLTVGHLLQLARAWALLHPSDDLGDGDPGDLGARDGAPDGAA